MNKVILMGNLTRDPDIRYTQGENSMAVARFTVAVNRRRSSQDGQREADFIGCVAFGRQAEFAERYLHQGSRITLSGRIQTGSYTNKDGQKVYTTDVVVEELEFAESKAASDARQGGQSSYQGGGSGWQGGNQNSYQGGGSSYQNNSYGGNQNAGGSPVGDGFMNIPEGVEDEGLPFN